MQCIKSALAAAALLATGSAQATVIYSDNFDTVNPAFSTQYEYVSPSPNALFPEGLYTIDSNPNNVHQYWSAFSNGTGNALIVNGLRADQSALPDLVFGSSAFTPTKTGIYTISASVADVCCDSTFSGPRGPSSLMIDLINGSNSMQVAMFTTKAGDSMVGYPGAGVFEQVTAEVQLTAGRSYGLNIMNGSGVQSGNDFAIDNISVGSVPEPGTWAMMLLGFGVLGMVGYRQCLKVMISPMLTA